MVGEKRGKGCDGGGVIGRGEIQGNRGGGGPEEAAPPLGDKGDCGGGRRWQSMEDFLEELVAKMRVHFEFCVSTQFNAPLFYVDDMMLTIHNKKSIFYLPFFIYFNNTITFFIYFKNTLLLVN